MEVAAVATSAEVLLATVLLAGIPLAGAASPAPTLSPGPYRAGQQVTITVGPNKTFTPGAGIYILECADPGGLVSDLPVSDSSCDGNTVQGNTVIVAADGSITEKGYVFYKLPDISNLGEHSDSLPICDATHDCVLYVGQEQNNFTRPHVFTAPFLIGGPWSPPGGSGTSGFPILAVSVSVIGIALVGGTYMGLRRRPGEMGRHRGRSRDGPRPRPALGGAGSPQQRSSTKGSTEGTRPEGRSATKVGV